MTFYERCLQLRNHYLLIDPEPLKLTLLSKIVAYSFYNYKMLDELPFNETIYINCDDISEHYRNLCSNLNIVLLDLGYDNIDVNINYFKLTRSLCFTLIVNTRM